MRILIVGRKRIKAGKPEAQVQLKEDNALPSKAARAKDPEQQIKALVEKGREKGYLTYEEMNEDLPEEAVTPARLDSLLATLDEIGVDLLDEGVDVWRPIESEIIGNNIFRIPIDAPIPERENWQFSPGDLVRCELKPISETDKCKDELVAVKKIEEKST